MASDYRTDDLPEPARTPEQQAEYDRGAQEALAKLGDAHAAAEQAKARLANAGKARGSVTGGGYGPIKGPGASTKAPGYGSN